MDDVIEYVQTNGKKFVEVEDAELVLAEKTGITFTALNTKEKSRLAKIEDIIHEKLINQKLAVDLIGKSLRSKMAGVARNNKPLGSFLFLGPTGVGKTKTAKVLAEVYYGSENKIIRFDMAEFGGNEGLERLVGSVNKNLPGALTTAIKNNPASLLLLDEFEKAGRPIFNLFLSLLDEGFMTDAFGKKIGGSNLFIIATSNAGAEYIRELVNDGVKGDELHSKVINYVLKEQLFPPELVNRFDGVVVYQPLGKEELISIAKLKFEELAEKLLSKNIKLKIQEGTAEKLAEEGYDPAFGARPMERILDLVIGDIIGRSLLEEKISEGNTVMLSGGPGKNEYLIEKTS